MAKTVSIQIADELKNQYNSTLQRRDRFELGVIQSQRAPITDAAKKKIKELSQFQFFGALWRALSEVEKQVWKDAAVFSSLSGWQLFVSDNSARIKASLPLDVPPNVLWQVWAGYIKIESPATEIILRQEHPQKYWTAKKVKGQSWKNELFLLQENFNLPLEIQVRYKSSLVATGSTQSARFFARVWSSYQGQDIYTDLEITVDPDTDWVLGTATLSTVIGHVIGYSLNIEIIGYTGEFLFDNIRAIHTGTNWTFDPRCDNISKTFTKAFAVVPPYWVPLSLPPGATYYSELPPVL